MGLTRVLILVGYATVAAAAVSIVLLTRYGNDPTLLAAATREGGPFETLSVLSLLSLAVWSLVQSRRTGPAAMPRQIRGPVPRSSAPTGRLAFPVVNTKTALPRRSA